MLCIFRNIRRHCRVLLVHHRIQHNLKLTWDAAGEFIWELLHQHVVDVILEGAKDDNRTSIAAMLQHHWFIGWYVSILNCYSNE